MDATLYLSLKALHLIAVVAWMAGVMYLPRLFVYHISAIRGGEHSETLKVMERRLFYGIMTPSLVAVWVLGVVLAIAAGAGVWSAGWFHIKLALVAAVTAIHVYYGLALRKFGRDERPQSRLFFKAINELPFVFFAIIVFLVLLKPSF